MTKPPETPHTITPETPEKPEKPIKPITGKHVFWSLVVFFGVIIIVNGIMVYFATDTFTGIETENAYKKGLSYNDTLEDAARQHELGWQITITTTPHWQNVGQLTLTAINKHGHPLRALTGQVTFRRPTHEGHDRQFTLTEIAPGRYSTPTPLTLPGQWDMTINLGYNKQERFISKQRITVKGPQS